MAPLKKLWASLDFACGKRMAPGHGRRATSKPGTLLRSQIPARTGTERDDARPGFLEIDLAAHCGTSRKGEHCNTLDAADIATGWTETRALRNKARVHVFAALKASGPRFPRCGSWTWTGPRSLTTRLDTRPETASSLSLPLSLPHAPARRTFSLDWGVMSSRCFWRIPLAEGLALAERIHSAVRAHDFAAGGRLFSLGASIDLIPVFDGGAGGHAMAHVNTAMYEAKRMGGEQTRMMTPTVELTRNATAASASAQEYQAPHGEDALESARNPLPEAETGLES